MAVWAVPNCSEGPLLNPSDVVSDPLPMMEPAWQHDCQTEPSQQVPASISSHHHQLPQHGEYNLNHCEAKDDGLYRSDGQKFAGPYAEHTQYDQGSTYRTPSRPLLHAWHGAPQYDINTSNHPPTPISPFNCMGAEATNSSVQNCPTTVSMDSWSADLSLQNGQHPISPDMTRLPTAASSRRCSVPTPTNVSPPPQGSCHYPDNTYDTAVPEPIPSMPRSTRSLPTNFPSHFSHTSSGPRRASSNHNLAVDRIQRSATLGRRASTQSLSRAQSPSRLRVPHNLVERRYRDNLNNQIESLRLALPSLRDARPSVPLSSVSDPEHDDVGMSMLPRMPSKAVIISTAANYIRDLEAEREHLLAGTRALQEQVSALQKLVRCDDCSILGYFSKMPSGLGAPPSVPSSSRDGFSC
jgi:hypothetical protein